MLLLEFYHNLPDLHIYLFTLQYLALGILKKKSRLAEVFFLSS